MLEPTRWPRPTAAFLNERLSRIEAACREASVPFHDDAGVDDHLSCVLLASDFAYHSLLREPSLLGADFLQLMSDPRHADARAGMLAEASDATELRRLLRRFRLREALRLIWRDVTGTDTVETTLAGASVLAETCLEAALRGAEAQVAQRHGVVCDARGRAQRMVVFALGKLGGGELNFSSDIDLVFAFAEHGDSDGGRPLDATAYYARIGQALVALLADHSVDGYVYRVDLRLRPFGSAGRLALSFTAMEQYFQREGRDWERYAWIKARPVAGDRAAGARLLETLRPFVFRRYLDYTAFAGLREMKTLIDAEVVRKDLAANLKLGPGGIREIEFVVQLLQLIRGGREPSLRERGLLPALTACERLGALPAASALRLREAYRFLRRIENRVQMLRDEQTHDVPDEALARARLAAALNFPDWSALAAELARVRSIVSEEFALLLAPATTVKRESTGAAATYWRRLSSAEAQPAELAQLGFADAEHLHGQLLALRSSPAARALSAQTQARFERLLPHLLDAAAAGAAPDACIERLLRLLHAVLRRPAYLALLEERPQARERLVALFADSALLAERVIAHPLLLDDLLAVTSDAALPDRASLDREVQRRIAQIEDADTEAVIEILQEERNSAAFRVGLAYRDGLDAVIAARALSAAAESVVAQTLALAERDLARQYGRLPGLAVIGYGSLGGAELGFASDLDLVFVYDSAIAQRDSDGAQALEGVRYFARLAQRVVHWLTAQTRAGKLYEVDVRLRPDGGKGLLVVGLDAFAEYQRERAWIWETQALVRARAIAGDAATIARFGAVRADLLARAREPKLVLGEVGAMRARWRAERDRSNAAMLDLKQGAGALLDIEFILQTLVLLHANTQPQLLASGNSAELIARAGASGILDPAQAQNLQQAHAALLQRALACTLDARPRLVPRDAELEQQTQAVLAVGAALGLMFA